MGSKNLKAIVVEGKTAPIEDEERFKFLLYETRKLLRASPLTSQALPEFGTAVLMNIINNIGALPTRNHQQTQFEGARSDLGRGTDRKIPGQECSLLGLPDRLHAHQQDRKSRRRRPGVRNHLGLWRAVRQRRPGRHHRSQ
jgi:hypothetical protein